jgi:hypothetical protein
VRQFVLRFDDGPPQLPPIRGVIQCIPQGNTLRLTLVNVTQEVRATLQRLGALSIDEAPISLEDAFVSYLGGSLQTVRLPQSQQEAAVAGGVR